MSDHDLDDDAAKKAPEAANAPTRAAAGEPAAPRKRRAPRRKAAEQPADVAPADDAANVQASAAAALPLDPASTVVTMVPDAADRSPEPFIAPRRSAEPDAGVGGDVAASVDAAGTAGETPVDAAGTAAASAGGEAGAATPRDGGRRGRNRRRGRGADRPPREAGSEGDDGAPVQPAPPATPPVDPAELFAEVLSGAFDTEPAEEPAGEATDMPKRILAPEPDAPKLHKVLAQAGIGSRRDMEQWVQEGRVTVNGEPAHIGQRISFGDRIAIGGKPVKVRIAPPPPRVLAYHKPAGEVVTHDDPQNRPTVFRKLPRLPQGKWQSVGRLDINTEGLLLFTNSGELANHLMHPRFGVEREYAVRSLGLLDDEQRARLLEGVDIDGQRAAFKSIEDGGGEGANHWYRVVITEGRNREVRRLFEAVGHAVSRLIRIRYGSVVLPRGLRRGQWVDLPEGDVRTLRRLTIGERHERAEDGPGKSKRGRRGGRQRDQRPREPGMQTERAPRPDRPPRGDGDNGHIPNPLQQTYDKRAIQQARSTRREIGEDDPIPNPLQQTYDKRALQRDRAPRRELSEDGPIPNPLQQTYDKRFVQGSGRPGGGKRGAKPGAPGRQPDPMQTSVGYIGADALRRKGSGGGGRGGRGRGGQGGRGGGGGGGGGGRGR